MRSRGKARARGVACDRSRLPLKRGAGSDDCQSRDMTHTDFASTSGDRSSGPVPVVAVGASSGGIAALRRLVSGLPADLPAALMIVLHIGEHASRLPWLLSTVSALPAAHAVDGEAITAGRIYVAPPDHHLTVDADSVRLSRGPKEHHTRPAIDPLFRSAAIAHGRRAIGIVLSGLLDDGTAGLQAIKKFGGTAMVQDPREAEEPSMPLSAMKYSDVDDCLPVESLAQRLVLRIEAIRAGAVHGESASPQVGPDSARQDIAREQALMQPETDPLSQLQAIAQPSALVCPDCHGGLWEINAASPPRYRCHTGHGYSLRTLAIAHAESTDAALWSAIRALKEKEMILRRLANVADERQDATARETNLLQADVVSNQAAVLRKMVEKS